MSKIVLLILKIQDCDLVYGESYEREKNEDEKKIQKIFNCIILILMITKRKSLQPARVISKNDKLISEENKS